MKAIFKSVLFLILSTSMTSCYEVIDEISIKDDGSGEFLLNVNMSKSKTKLESIMLLESYRDRKVPSKEEIEEIIEEVVLFLKQSEGLSNVNRTIDFEEFIFTISFSFESVENINQAIQDLNLKYSRNPKSLDLKYSYDPSKKQYARHFVPNEVDQTKYEELDEEDKNMFNEAIYVSISRFESMISECSNKKAKISKSGKAIMIRTSATNLFTRNNDITNIVQLK